MLVRMKYETDGKCVALVEKECTALTVKEKGCGTYQCPFYKPEGCKQWVRIDKKASVYMYEPGEKKCY